MNYTAHGSEILLTKRRRFAMVIRRLCWLTVVFMALASFLVKANSVLIAMEEPVRVGLLGWMLAGACCFGKLWGKRRGRHYLGAT
jgi:hypothetical protein